LNITGGIRPRPVPPVNKKVKHDDTFNIQRNRSLCRWYRKSSCVVADDRRNVALCRSGLVDSDRDGSRRVTAEFRRQRDRCLTPASGPGARRRAPAADVPFTLTVLATNDTWGYLDACG